MKKFFSVSILLVLALAYTSCSPSEEDDLFDKSAAERLNEASALYSSRLMASPNGWAMQLYPTNENEYPYGNGYLLLCRFNADHSVNVSMDNVFSDNKYLEDTSLWEVLTDNGPVLSFNSHNKCIHAFSDPEDLPFTGTSDVENIETGTGCGGDYEFIIVDAPADASYMMLKGKKRGAYNLLTPVEEGVTYASYLADVKSFQKTMFSENAPTFNVIHFGDSIYKMTGANDGIPNIYPYDGDEIIDESFNAFLVTRRGDNYYLRFRDEIKLNDNVTLQEFVYNKEKDVFESVIDAQYYISGDDPVRFYQSTYDTDGIFIYGNPKYNWVFNSSSAMSDKMKGIVDQISAEFKARNMTFSSMFFTLRKGEVSFCVSYVNKSGATGYLYFFYDIQNTPTGQTLSYKGYENQEYKVLELAPTLNEFITVNMSQAFKVSAGTTAFDLNNIKLTAESDPNLWFTMKLTKMK